MPGRDRHGHVRAGRPRRLAELGIGPGDLATIVVTHIHLDHAGGVGTLAGMFPRADMVVHERGPGTSWTRTG